MKEIHDNRNLWAVILTAGTSCPDHKSAPARSGGRRLKHFCGTYESDYALGQTRKQAALVFPAENTKFVVTRESLSCYEDVLADIPMDNLMVEPEDNGSVFGVLYALFRLVVLNPSAVVAFFTSNFQAASARQFSEAMKNAVSAARSREKLILLGSKPENPDLDGDLVEPDFSVPPDEIHNAWRVERFVHRPGAEQARNLIKSGALLNSVVAVGTVSAFLQTIRRAAPQLYKEFSEAKSKIGTSGEPRAIEQAYASHYIDTDFSRDVLAQVPDALAVIPVSGAIRYAAGVRREALPAATGTARDPRLKYAVARDGRW